MKRLLITGASGLLGLNLALEAIGDYEVTGVVHSHSLRGLPFPTRTLDLTCFEDVIRMFDEARPEAVIHCAALTNMDTVEVDPDPAWRLNGEVPALLADECAKRDVKFVHISTDAVFDGKRGNYAEEDSPNPVSLYARTKLAGEQGVLKANPNAVVARVVFYGWSISGKRSLAEWFLNNLAAGQEIQGFADILFCPLQANQLARLLIKMLESGLAGVYHVVSRDSISKYEFGTLLADRFGLNRGLIRPVSQREAVRSTPRAPILTLRTDKLAAALGDPLPDVRSGIEEFYRLARDGYADRVANLGSGLSRIKTE